MSAIMDIAYGQNTTTEEWNATKDKWPYNPNVPRPPSDNIDLDPALKKLKEKRVPIFKEEITKAKIEALRYAISLCVNRRTNFKVPAYNAACDEIKLFLEASIERLESGEDMQSYAYTQSEKEKNMNPYSDIGGFV